jgi:transcriptional regulator with XRE-family HTH domain
MDYSRALRVCRALRGWRQDEVAEYAKLSTSYVSLIEAGRRIPSLTAVAKLARALRIPEPLFTLLAMDVKSLPRSEAKAFDDLGRSLLSLLVEAGSEKKAAAR